jgi:exodeoxyribonuclease V alpha subunit
VTEIEELMEGESRKESPNLQWITTSDARKCQRHCEAHWKSWTERAAQWTTLLSDTTKLTSPKEASLALDALGDFQLLCSTNEQVRIANESGRRILLGEGRPPHHIIPHACPLIITANDRSLNLSNGDVGIALARASGQPALVALFPGTEAEPRLIPLAQLPPHQPAFGITIHKSQGSEWKHIVIQLPDHGDSQILSRNLLYTAVTRSSGKIDLFGKRATLASVLQE